MSSWYDEHAGKTRTSLPYKIFYVWLWPLERWVMFNCMTSEFAHWFALHVAIPFVGKIDRIWGRIAAATAFVAIVVIALLSLLPGFRLEKPEEEPTP